MEQTGTTAHVAASAITRLSRRELQVLERLAQGQSNAQVAAGLEITVHAVKFHVGSVFRKLDVHNRTEAATLYLRSGAPGS